MNGGAKNETLAMAIPVLVLATVGCQFLARCRRRARWGRSWPGHAAEFNASVAVCYDKNWVAPEPKDLDAIKAECDGVQKEAKRWENIAEMLAGTRASSRRWPRRMT